MPQSPDVIINISADNTAAFSAWAMGTRAPRCSLADLTGAPPLWHPPGMRLTSRSCMAAESVNGLSDLAARPCLAILGICPGWAGAAEA